MTDTTQLNDLLNHGLAGFLVVQGIDWLKKWNAFSWIRPDTTAMNRLLGLLAAAFATAGMEWTYQNGTLTVTGLTLAGVVSFGFEFVKQWAAQQFFYKAAFQDGKDGKDGKEGGPRA